MNFQEHTQPDKLERYSFLWSEIRLLIAAVALFLGGYPPLLYIFRISSLYGIENLLLKLCWIISGVASGYLLYRWFTGNKMLFGGKANLDTAAFFVSIVSGINLGITGLLGTNIGLSISSNKLILVIFGLLYLASAYHLSKRWKASGKKLF